MTINGKPLVQFHIDPIDLEQVNINANMHYKGNVSELLRDAVRTLNMFITMNEKLKTDKDKSAFFEQLEKNLKSEDIFKFMETLEPDVLGAIVRAAQLTRESKYQNERLL